jgi:DNA primase
VNDAWKERVRAATDIVELIGERVPLLRKGRVFKGLCPYHKEKTPSFTVSPEHKNYYCFGCKARGDVFDFVKWRDGLSFPEALRMLSSRAGIPEPDDDEGRAVHHVYTDAAGTPVLRISRRLDAYGKTAKKSDGTKDISRQVFQGGEWRWPGDVPKSLKPDMKGLVYNWPAVTKAIQAGKTVHIGEGERVADALIELGLVATCNPGGAASWNDSHAERLRGATDVVIWQDCGKPGKDFVERVGASLAKLGRS